MQAIALIKTFISFVGMKVAVALNVAAGAQATMAIGSAVIAGTALVAKKTMSLFEVDMAMPDTDRSRQSTVKSASEPQKIIYGKALVSGPISFIGLGGTDNSDLYQAIVLAGHQVDAIQDIYFDDVIITNSQINSGNTAGGAVNAGAFSPQNGVDIVTINKYLGASSQTADQMFVSQFGNYTNAHRGDGIAYIAMKWVLNADSAKTWDKFAPSNVKALVRGKKVYDPRLEVTAGGDAGDSPNNSSYIAYSDNPALCAIDYLMDQNVGLSVPSSKIDWSAVITAANGCDATVTVPGGTEKTFTCNGVVFATDTHQKNINKILSSMNGSLVYSNGKYVLRAGIYANPTVSLNEDDLIGSITVKTSIDRSERVNTIKGLFLDPSQGHKMVEFPKVQLSNELQRDNNVVMEKETSFSMTNTSYMAQRLAHKIIKSAGQQKVITFPANYSALNVTAGDRVEVSIEELSWVNKIFVCVSWVFSEDGGVLLTLREDSSDAYSNPTSYSQVSGTGTITDASRGVPSPSGLQVESAESKIFLNWVNPTKPSDFNTIEVWASATNVRSNAVNIGETNGTQFTHDQSNSAITYAVGDTLYYWVRAKKNVGDATDTDAVSGYFPATTTSSANVTVTAAAVDWDNVANPTIGIDINSDTISINTGSATTTTGQDVATSGIEAGTTVTQGGITMNQGGSIKGGQSGYNTGTGFFLGYVDGTPTGKYKFSIGNASNEALTFDGTNLAVTGDITATSGTFDGTVNASAGAFTGDVSTDSKFVAGSGDATTVIDGGASAAYRIFSGAAQAESENAPFQVKPDGSVFAKNITVFDASGNILLNQDGLGAAALAGISLTSGTAVDKVSGVLSGDGGEMTLTLDQTATVTLETKFAIYDNSVGTLYFYGSGATEAAAKSDITNSTLNIIYSLQTDGGSYSTAATKPITFTSTDSTPSSTEIYVTAVYIAGGIQEYRSILMDAGGALEYIANTSTYGATAYVVTSHTFTNLPAGVHKVKLSSTVTGSGSPSAAGQSTSNRLYELTSSAVNFVESAANVFANGTPSVPTGGGTVSGNLVVTGDLTVSGTTTFVNTDELTVKDQNITVNYSTGDSSSTANNAGITIQDAVDASTDASILWKTASDSFEFSHPVKDLSLTGDLISDSSIYLRSAGGVAGVYLQDTSGGSTSTAFRLYSDVDSTTVNIDTGGSQTIAAFVNNGNLLITGTIYADGAASNSLQWETGYDYSQVGHLPLAGGTLTGALTVNQNGDALNLRSTTNAQLVRITFSSDVPATQIGHIEYTHSNGASYGSGEAFIISGTESTRTILADGKLMFAEGIYSKPASGTGGGTRKDSNWDSAYTYSQVGHLPLAGGTLTGGLSGTTGTFSGDVKWSGGAPYLEDSSSQGRIPAPAGGYYSLSQNVVTGAFKIKLPTATNNNSTMLTFEVRLFDYNERESVVLQIAGYAYASGVNWNRQAVQILSSTSGRDYTVRFGSDGTSNCLWIGELTSTWSYPKLGIFNLMVGHSTVPSEFASGWAITLVTAFDTVQDTITGNLPYASVATSLSGQTSTIAELNYTDGVTSSIQTQLNSKLNLSGGTLTGTLAMGANAITSTGTISSGGITTVGASVFNSYSASDPDSTSRTNYPAGNMFTHYSQANGVSIIGGQGGYTGSSLTIGEETGRSANFNFIRGISDTNGTPAEEFSINGVGDAVFAGTISSGAITSTGTSVFDRIQTGLGTVASPAVKVGDNDSGFYDSGANMIGVALGGVLEYDFQPTGLYLNNNGIFDAGNITLANESDIQLYTTSGSTGGGSLHLPRGGFITFYGNGNADHSIASRDNAGNVTDDLRISSYASVYFDLDSNGNNSSTADFVIGRHGSGTGTMATLLTVSGETGAITTSGTISSGDVTTSGTFNIGSLGSIGAVATDRIFIATADGLGLQLDKDNNRIVPVGADGTTYNNNVSLGSSSLEFKNLALTGTISSGAITAIGTITSDNLIIKGGDSPLETEWGTAPTAIIGGFSSGNHDGSAQLTNFRMAVISKDTNGGNTPAMQRNQAWVTGGISGEAYNSAARWDLGRWENSSVDSRSRLDLYLADDSQTWDHVMTWRADGSNVTRVGINTTTPTATLDVNGTISSGAITATSLTTSGDIQVNGNQVRLAASQARVKYSVWTGETYGIGMQTGYTFGPINNDYVMSFQMNQDNDRGFWWGDASHTNAQGAMALSTDGYLTVARGMRIGYGESDTTKPTAGLQVSGNIEVNGNVDGIHIRGDRLYANNDGSTGYFYNDTSTRVAYTGGDFYIRSTVGNCFIYATNTYLGASSGDNIYLRGNRMSHNGWNMTTDGHIIMYDSQHIRFGSAGDAEFFCNGSHMYTDLNSGIGNWYIRDGSTTRYTFNDNGTFTATGNITAYSDIRLKDDIKQIENALFKVQQLSGNTYTRNDLKEPNRRYAGLIAQQVELVLEEAVTESDDGMKTLDYSGTIALLVEAIKELKFEVDELKAKLEKD